MRSRVIESAAAKGVAPVVWPPARLAPQPEPEPLPPSEPVPASVGPSEEEILERERRAFECGRSEGEAEARAAGAAAVSAAIERFARAASELSGYKPRLRREAEQDVVRLALAIARRVLNRELSIDGEALLGIVRTALEKLDRREVRRLRMHPEDAPALKPHVAMEVVPDAAVGRGGVVFETDRGIEDWSVETQLDEIQRGLTDRLRGGATWKR